MKAAMGRSKKTDGPTQRSSLLERLRNRSREFKTQIDAIYFAFQDPRTPWFAKLLAILVVAYAVSPIDLIPDFLPVIGYLDDLVIVPAGIALAVRLIPSVVMDDARQRAAQSKVSNTRFGWVGTFMIVAIWILIIAIGLSVFLYVNNRMPKRGVL
jgi:uncharacterized membrane protein YkvA (DUF1232 family)